MPPMILGGNSQVNIRDLIRVASKSMLKYGVLPFLRPFGFARDRFFYRSRLDSVLQEHEDIEVDALILESLDDLVKLLNQGSCASGRRVSFELYDRAPFSHIKFFRHLLSLCSYPEITYYAGYCI